MDSENGTDPRVVGIQQKARKYDTKRSMNLFKKTKRIIPTGASSLMRTSSWDPYPLYINKGKGTRIWDADGNEYTDFLMAFGPVINGHANDKINAAVRKFLRNGSIFGAPNELEYKLAREFKKFVTTQDMVIFSLSGSDATFNALRIARAATGKDMILKFEGHYHGLHDYAAVSVEAPAPISGLRWFPKSLPYSAGIPPSVMDTVVVASWNDLESLTKILRIRGNEIAAIIMEPVMANSTVISPEGDYLKAVRELADEYNILLVFDEVITGFRVSEGGAQKLYGVTPDLSAWAKALGNGYPISAIAGKKEYMELIGNGVGYGGTYYASPLSMAASLANLKLLEADDFAAYSHLGRITRRMARGIEDIADNLNENIWVNYETGVLAFVFTEQKKIRNYRESVNMDWNKYKAIQQKMLQKGFYYHPDGAERLPPSVAHTEDDVDRFLVALEESIKEYNKEN
ncbi:MAG: aspartate aminotransferase family protein [Candidatus Thermoplasmatota archaeon]|jgi:glutamate-1-semialdehyde 2,1-aminomutase|nr:aspartate aminotransferase family protein [Candidatus Thermoplasmatota archaeon]MCL5681173.1 aspartate aminotransferase family protein [Candidatus Thermoplasmatota archaeon]